MVFSGLDLLMYQSDINLTNNNESNKFLCHAMVWLNTNVQYQIILSKKVSDDDDDGWWMMIEIDDD